MNLNKIRITKFSQNQTDLISAVLPFKLINELSEVKIYGKPDGYQRKPNRIHFTKVKNYITSNLNNFKFPTSIILGVNDNVFSKELLKEDDCGFYLDFSSNTIDKIFRIVDGQHRIEGLKLVVETNPDINDFLLPVLIILSNEKKKSTELEIFTTINSTAKRISVDLAELAKHSYQIKEGQVNQDEIIKFICIETAYNLKARDDRSIWSNAIKFDIHSEITIGIVGVTMFTESITAIVEKYIDKTLVKSFITGNKMDDLISYCQQSAATIADDLDNVWNIIIKAKWKNCFTEEIVKNDDNELVKIFYSKNYYIQQTMGVKALNIIYSECIKKYSFGDKAYNEFNKIVQESTVTVSDWKKGSKFAGLSSESGFTKVRKIIKNELQ